MKTNLEEEKKKEGQEEKEIGEEKKRHYCHRLELNLSKWTV